MVNDTLGFACGSDQNLYRSINGGLNWELLQAPFYISLYSIEFVNENIGWAGGYNPYILKTTNGGNNWDYQLLPVYPYGFNIFSIHFNNSNFGYVAAIENEHGVILITTDAGNNWNKIVMETSSLGDAYFSDLQNGWARTADALYKTTNGGITWEIKALNCAEFFFIDDSNSWGIFDLNRIFYSENGWDTYNEQIESVTSEFLQSITIKDTLNVFVCGQENIIGTTDGGKNWNIYFSSTPDTQLNSITTINNFIWAVGNFGQVVCSKNNGSTFEIFFLPAYWLSDVYFIDENKGFIVGGNVEGEFFLTTDAGLTWDSLQTTPKSEGFNKIKFSSDSIGYMSSNEGIYKSTDQGNTWQLVNMGFFQTLETINNSVWTSSMNNLIFTTNQGLSWNTVEVYEIDIVAITIESISFADINNGWLSVSDGRRYKTSDGGFSWTEEERLAGVSLNSIKFLNKNCGWAVGSGGIILHYGNKTTDIDDGQISLIEKYHLSQNYPNPFNPVTTIKFSVPEISYVTFKVYDMLGKEITALVNEEKPAGSYEVKFDGSNLSSGIYFYQLKAGSFIQTKKMILLK
jgi:photosystem II stability/assembly factor-like uncharacterized protein